MMIFLRTFVGGLLTLAFLYATVGLALWGLLLLEDWLKRRDADHARHLQ